MDRRRALLAASQTGGDFKPIIDINNYLTIEALEDGLTARLSTNECEYCVDGDGNWKTLSASTNTDSINIGQTLSFRGELIPDTPDGIGTFTISKKCNLLGNCMSMLYGDNAANKFSLSGNNYAFRALFDNCYTIISVSKKFLPATTLSRACYSQLFQYCSGLTTPPELPATTMEMDCYSSMFRGCGGLTSAPELPATTLKIMCYSSMFRDCTKLNYIKMLATDISASSCLNNWVKNVASSGTFVKNKNATWTVTGVNGVPSGWTIQKV